MKDISVSLRFDCMGRNDDELVATKGQWRSLLDLTDRYKIEIELLKKLLDEANEERYKNRKD